MGMSNSGPRTHISTVYDGSISIETSLKVEALKGILWRVGWQLLAMTLPFGNTSLAFLVLLLSALLPPYRHSTQPSVTGSTLRWMMLFTAVLLASAITSPATPIALASSAAYIVVIYVVFLGARNLVHDIEFFEGRFLPILVGASLLSWGYGILSYFMMHEARAVGAFTGYMGFSMLIVMMIGACLGYLEVRHRKWIVPYLLVGGIALVVTFTRSAWIAFPVVVIMYSMRNKRLLTIILLFLVLLTSLVVTVEPFHSYMLQRFHLGANGRIGIWRTVLNIIDKNPVLGVGMGVHPVVYGDYLVDGAMPNAGHAHNLELGLVADLGIGALAYFWILGMALKKAILFLRGSNAIHRGFAAAYLGVLVQLQFDIPTYGFELGVGFFFLLGVLLNLGTSKRENESLDSFPG